MSWTVRARVSTAALLVLGAVVPMSGAAAAAAPHTTTSTTGSVVGAGAPVTPATGHFHALTTPQRVVSTLTGTGIAKKPLAKGAAKTLAIGGHAGIPRAKVRAVAVTLTAFRPAGATKLWAATGTTRPSVPSVATGRGTASAFAIVPLSSTGKMRVWNGAHATGLTVDVTGWFSGRSESNAAGLFNRLAGRQLKSSSIAAGKTRTVALRGVEDVPASGVGSMLLRLHVAQAKGAGRVSVASTASAGKGVSSLAYAKGSTDDLAVARLSDAGGVVVHNFGAKPVTVAVDAVGTFTKGGSATQFGDSLRLSHPTTLLKATSVDTAGARVALAGAHGVPAVSGAEPPSLVLVRALADNPSRTTALTLDPADATPARLPALSVRSGTARAGVVLGQPGTTGGATFAASRGIVRTTAETYGWFAGGLRLSPNLHSVSPTELAAISAVTADTVVFSAAPVTITNLAAGEILSSGPTAATPYGLLRKVVSVEADTPSAGDTTVHTSPGSLDEVILQGHVSAGASSPGTLKAAAHAAAHRIPSARPSILGAPADCVVSGGPIGVGATVNCSHTFAKDGASVEVGASAGVGLDVDVTWWHGLLPTHAHITMQSSHVVRGSISAGGTSDFDESYDLPHLSLTGGEPVVIPAGEVPIVLFPFLTPKIELTGHTEAGLSASGEVSLAVRMDIDTTDGVTESHQIEHQDSTNFSGSVTPITVHPQFIPAVTVFFYDNPWALTPDGVDPPPEGGDAFENGGGVWAGFGVGPTLEIDACTAQWSYQASYHIGATLLVFGHDLLSDFNHQFDLGTVKLAAVPWRDCAIWSGHFKFVANLAYDNGAGYSRTLHSTSAMTVDSYQLPPQSQIYDMTGSGGGVDTQIQPLPCDGQPFTETLKVSWGGDITTGSGPPTVQFAAAEPGNWVVSLYPTSHNGMQTPATETIDNYGYDTEIGACKHFQDSTDIPDWSQNVFGIFGPGDTSITDQIYFTLPPGETTATGTADFAGATPDAPSYHVEYSVTKTCVLGGTDCSS